MCTGYGLGALVRSLELPTKSSTSASPQSYVIRSCHQLGSGGWGWVLSAARRAASLAALATSPGGIPDCSIS